MSARWFAPISGGLSVLHTSLADRVDAGGVVRLAPIELGVWALEVIPGCQLAQALLGVGLLAANEGVEVVRRGDAVRQQIFEDQLVPIRNGRALVTLLRCLPRSPLFALWHTWIDTKVPRFFQSCFVARGN